MAVDETSSDSRTELLRRRFLGALGAAGVASLAGCAGGGRGDEQTPLDRAFQRNEVDVSDVEEGGTLDVALTSSPNSFDPPYSNEVPSTLVQNFFYESLLTTDTQGNAFPWLAESFELVEIQSVGPRDYEPYMRTAPAVVPDDGRPFVDVDEQIIVQHPEDSPAQDEQVRVLLPEDAAEAVADGTFGMQYQYDLHEGIEFGNGEELTADNVVRSVRRYENSPNSAQTFDSVLHAEAVDDYTVNLYAQAPDAEAEIQVSNAAPVFPTELLETEGGNMDPRQGNDPVGTGPWQFEEFQDEEVFRVSLRDNYWLEDIGLDAKDWWDGPDEFPEKPVIDEINMRFVPEDAQRAGALQDGDVDVTSGLTSDAQTNFLESEGFGVSATETGGYLYMQYPVQIEPWDQQEVRRAANHLIPRGQISQEIEQGWTRPAWTPIPSLAYGAGTTDPEQLEEDLRPLNEFDPERAQELIEEAGVETPISAQIETNSDNQDRVRKVEAIAQSMNDTDLFDINVETFEFGDFVGRILSQDYWERGNIVVVGLSGTFNPGSFVDATHGADNWGQCCNSNRLEFPDLDEMTEEARFSEAVIGDQEERASRYDEIWRRVVELSANSYIDIDTTVACYNDDVVGFNTYPFTEGLYSYALHAPIEQQVVYLDDDG